MDLNIYDIILGPVVTDKVKKLNQDLKKLVLRVHPHANKPMIKSAVKALFKVEVEAVNIVNRQGKSRRVGRRIVQGAPRKIAIVTLAKGQRLDLFDQAGVKTAASEVSAA